MIEVAQSPSHPETTDPRIPPRDHVVTRDLIERWALEQPEKVLVKFDDDGEEWTYSAFRERVLQVALGYQRLAVAQGDHVLVWAPNSREHLITFFALNYIGAVYVPINTAYKGGLLEHVIAISDARLAVVHADLCPRLADVALAMLERVVTIGGAVEMPLPSQRFEETLTPTAGRLAPPTRPIEPWDPMAIMFTSGTTGPSKGVLVSYLHAFTNAGPESWPSVTGDDRWLLNFPAFHMGGMAMMYVMLVRGMTEVSSPIVSDKNPIQTGTCGKARPGVEVRLVDDNDCEVPPGQVGEMIVRTDRPWGIAISTGRRNTLAKSFGWCFEV